MHMQNKSCNENQNCEIYKDIQGDANFVYQQFLKTYNLFFASIEYR